MQASWIETESGNRISKSADLKGTRHISIGENCTISPGVVICGDVETATPNQPTIVLGKYCFLDQDCYIMPPETRKSGVFGNMYIGNYTLIGRGSKVHLAQVGNRVSIGSNCTLGAHSIVNDCCVIADGTVIPPKAVIPPYSAVSGVPGESYMVESVGPGYRRLLENDAKLRQLCGRV